MFSSSKASSSVVKIDSNEMNNGVTPTNANYLQNVDTRRPLHQTAMESQLPNNAVSHVLPSGGGSFCVNFFSNVATSAVENNVVEPKLMIPCRSVRFGSFRTIPHNNRGVVFLPSGILLTVSVETAAGESTPAVVPSNFVGSTLAVVKPKPFAISIAWRHVELVEYCFQQGLSIVFLTVKEYCCKKIREVFGIADDDHTKDSRPFFGTDGLKSYHRFITVILSNFSQDWARIIDDFIAQARARCDQNEVGTRLVQLDYTHANQKLIRTVPPTALNNWFSGQKAPPGSFPVVQTRGPMISSLNHSKNFSRNQPISASQSTTPLLHPIDHQRRSATNAIPPEVFYATAGGYQNVPSSSLSYYASSQPLIVASVPVVRSSSASNNNPNAAYRTPTPESRRRQVSTRLSNANYNLTDANATFKRLRSSAPMTTTNPSVNTVNKMSNNTVRRLNSNNNHSTTLLQSANCTIKTFQIPYVMTPTNTAAGSSPATITILYPPQHHALVNNSKTHSPQQPQVQRQNFAAGSTDRELFVFPFVSESNNNDCITVCQYDRTRLDANEFLNDTIIDFYLKYVLMRVLGAEQRRRVHVFNTFFWHKLTTKPKNCVEPADRRVRAQQCHRRVRTWTKNVDLFDKDFVVIPINENAHWYLAIICYPGLKEPIFSDVPLSSASSMPTASEMLQHAATKVNAVVRPIAATPSDNASSIVSRCEIVNNGSSSPSVDMFDDRCLDRYDRVSEQCSQGLCVTSPASTGSHGNGAEDNSTINLTSDSSPVTSPHVSQPQTGAISVDPTSSVIMASPTAATVSDNFLEQEQDDEEDLEEAKEEQIQWALGDQSDASSTSTSGNADGGHHNQQQKRVLAKTPCVIVMDSLQSGTPRYKTVSLIRDYLHEEYAFRRKDEPARDFDRATFKGFYPKVPQQDNYHDCGVYVLQYAENFLVTPPDDLTHHGLKRLQYWFSPEQINAKRDQIKQLIDSLEEEYKKIKKSDPNVDTDNDDTIMSSS